MTPRFDTDDVLRLISRLPHLRLANPDRAGQLVDAMVHDAAELQHILAQYPQVLYEPLDAHYVVLNCLANLSEEFVEDLCTHYGWRGVVAAAWLVALAPRDRFRDTIHGAKGRAGHGEWLVELALCEIDNSPCPAFAGIQQSIRHLRGHLAHIPPGTQRLRRLSQATSEDVG